MLKLWTRPALLALPLWVAAAASSRAASMPQLDFKNPLTQWQIVWGGVIFALLYVVLSRAALPRVGRVIEDRQARIDGDLEAARQAKSESDRAIDELRRARREAAAESRAMLERVTAEAREAAARRMREMNARLDARIEEAEQQLKSQREQALGGVQQIASDAAQLLVERVTGKMPERGLVESRVEAVLARHQEQSRQPQQARPVGAAA